MLGEMSQTEDGKPNVQTYQLLFKNVRKHEERGPFEDLSSSVNNQSRSANRYKPDDIERVIQLFFQLDASQKKLQENEFE